MLLRRSTNNARRRCMPCCALRFRSNNARTCTRKCSSPHGRNSIDSIWVSHSRRGFTESHATCCGSDSASSLGSAPDRWPWTRFRRRPLPAWARPAERMAMQASCEPNARFTTSRPSRMPSERFLVSASSKASARKRSPSSSNRPPGACVCGCTARCSACVDFAKRNKNEA